MHGNDSSREKPREFQSRDRLNRMRSEARRQRLKERSANRGEEALQRDQLLDENGQQQGRRGAVPAQARPGRGSPAVPRRGRATGEASSGTGASATAASRNSSRAAAIGIPTWRKSKASSSSVAGPTAVNSAGSGEANFATARGWAASLRGIVADGSGDTNPTRIANAQRGVAATENVPKSALKHS